MLLLSVARVAERAASCIIDGLITTVLRVEQLPSASVFAPCAVEVVWRNLATVVWLHRLIAPGVLRRITAFHGLLLYGWIDLDRGYLLNRGKCGPWRLRRSSGGGLGYKGGLLRLAFEYQT